MPRGPADRFDLVAIAYVLWLGIALGLLIPYFVTLDGLRDATGNLLGRDFANMWTGAQAVARGAVARLFEVESFRAFQNGLFGLELPPHEWSYPPHLLLFIAPLALLSYPLALALWSAFGLAVFLATTTRAGAGRFEVAALALAPASLINLVTGQNGFFTAALFWYGLKSLERNPVIAGAAFGLLTIKPQLGLLIPFVLLIDRRWTVILSAAGTAALLFGAATLLFGSDAMLAYFSQALPHQTKVFTETHGIFISMIPTAYMNARVAGLGAQAAMLVQLPFSAAGIALALWAWARTDDPSLRAAALITGTFLASPYLFGYDLVAMTPVLLALWPRAEGRPGIRLVIGLVWSLPATAIALGLARLPVSALVLVAFALLVAREIAQTVPRPALAAVRPPA